MTVRPVGDWELGVGHFLYSHMSEHIVTIVGGGLAGCEAAWQAAERGVAVRLFEMRPTVRTPAHQTDRLAELVCSNSLKSESLEDASGLLKVSADDGHCLAAERFGPARIALDPIDAGQILQALGITRMVFAQDLLPDLQCLAQ